MCEKKSINRTGSFSIAESGSNSTVIDMWEVDGGIIHMWIDNHPDMDKKTSLQDAN